MSLLTLLPFGRAFTPSGTRSGRYQPAAAGLVPDFSGSKPSTPAPAPAPAPATATPPPPPPSDPGADSGTPLNPGSARRARASARKPLPGWLEQLILGLLRHGNRRRGTRPVQAELALQSVTPARNDLTTADLEVVPARRPGGPHGLSPACRQRILRLWWDQGTRRIRRWGRL